MRATNRGGGVYATYDFTYNRDPIPHLTSITNSIHTGEAYTFTYAEGQPLISPFNGQSFGTTTWLNSATVTNLNATHVFSYSSSGEMTKVVVPYGGYLAFLYGTTTYSSTNLSYREVVDRYISADGTLPSQLTYPLTHEPSPAGPVHQYTIMDDPSGTGEKYWAFNTSGPAISLLNQYQGRQLPGPTLKVQNNVVWSQDATGNNYAGTSYTTLDTSQTFSATKQVNQTVDTHGNVTQVQDYNYGTPGTGQPGTLARTFNYTYLNSSAYTSRYIFNRLNQATVTDGTNNLTLAMNAYDSYGCFGSSCNSAGLYTLSNVREWDSAYATVTVRGNPSTSSTPGHNTVFNGYDEGGNVMSATIDGVTTQLATAASNNFAAPTQLTVGSLTTNLSWSSFLGLTNETGPNGDSASTVYDQYARQSNTTAPFGASTAYTYSAFTNPPTTGQTATITINDTEHPALPSSGRWTKKTLDGFGRTILTQSADSSGTVTSQAETVYGPCACSPLGKLMKQAMPHAPGGSVAWTVYSYDGIGRTAAVVSPDGASTTSYFYAGNQVQVDDPAGKWKNFAMDALGNLVQVVEPDPANPGSYYVTTYGYDLLNNLNTVNMPRPTGTQTRTFVHNGPYLTSATNPENGTVTYTYNEYGKVATRTDAKGQVVVYTYDSYARLTEAQRYPQGTNNPEDSSQRETYYYDSNPFDPTYSNYVAGRLAAVQYYGPDGYGTKGGTTYTEMYNYNQAGAKLGKRLRIQRTYPYYYYWNGNGALTTGNTTSYVDLNGTYTYDSEGRMTGVQYPMSGPNLSWTFDTLGRLKTIGDVGNPGDIISAASYGPSNELLTMTGQVSESRTYNSMLQLTQLADTIGLTQKVNVTYSYSATQNNGKITSQTDNLSGEQVVYTYDALNRLASAQAADNSWGQSYSYDGFGNLTDQNVIAGSAPTYHTVYDPSNHHGCEDANGNTGGSAVSPCSSAITYDVENRMLYWGLAGQFQYSYAPGNKRVSRGVCCSSDYNGIQTMSTDEVVYWSVNGQKLATYQISGYGQFAGFPPNPSPLTATQTGTWYYFGGKMIKSASGYVGADRLGSIGHFYPYGQEKPSATQNGTEKFTGYLRDGETGMDYAINRYHVPGTGRFLTPDPYMNSAGPTDPGSWNRYAYTRGDPINRIDFYGMDDCSTDKNGDVCHEANGPGGEDEQYEDPCFSGDAEACYELGGYEGPSGSSGEAGGGGAPGGTSGITKTNQAQSALNSEIENLGLNCQKTLPATSTLKDDAGDLLFWDARLFGSMLIGFIPGAVSSQPYFTVGSAVANANAATLNGPNGTISNNVVLGNGFFNQDSATQAVTLLHELLHYALQLNDQDIVTTYGITMGVGDTYSSAFQQWLQNDCQNKNN